MRVASQYTKQCFGLYLRLYLTTQTYHMVPSAGPHSLSMQSLERCNLTICELFGANVDTTKTKDVECGVISSSTNRILALLKSIDAFALGFMMRAGMENEPCSAISTQLKNWTCRRKWMIILKEYTIWRGFLVQAEVL